MNVVDEVKLSCIMAHTSSLTKVLGTFGLPQYTLCAKKEWHLGFARLNGTPKGEQRPIVDWRRLFPGVPSSVRVFHVVMSVGINHCLV